MANDTDEEDLWKEFSPDSPLNWDFVNVPDDQIIACCIWEYARESKTIAMKADLHSCHVRHIWHREDYKRDPALKKEHDEICRNIEERAKREGFDYDSFCERFWKTDYPLMEIYSSVTSMVGDWSRAWQQLPQEGRTELSKKVSKSIVLRPLGVATVGELEALWKANSVELTEVRSRVRPEHDDSEDAALWVETEPVEPFANDDGALKEHLTVALTVDFSRFTDQEIASEFLEWLKEKRPHQWKKPRRVFPGARQKGKKLLEYRVALERLGLMRLLHFHSPAQLREELPNAWRRFVGKEPDFRREIREACKFFRRLFPFLPEGERPDSAERFGVWYPPVGKLMDELDREFGINGGGK